MTIEIRPAVAAEMGQFGLMGSYSYAGSFGDGPDNITATSNQPEWTLCAFDGETMATSFSAFPFTMRANGNPMAMAGISGVGTRPEYRRQGLLRKIMTRYFAEQRERGQSLACLWASQAAIYQRYGFAMMGLNRRYEVDTTDIGFSDGDEGGLAIRRHTPAEALTIAKALYRDFISDRFGYLHRSSALWMHNILEESAKEGPVYLAVAYDGEIPMGYVAYTFRSGRVDHPARGQELTIRDFIWLSGDAYRSLWSFIARHDLVGRVVWDRAPADDPATELFMEPRMLCTRENEGSWLRVVDVSAALAQRGFGEDGRIKLSIQGDTLAPWNNGTWRLTVQNGEAQVEATQDEPDVTMPVKTLASLFSGMHGAKLLGHWGLLAGNPDSISSLDRLFAVDHAPHCPDHY